MALALAEMLGARPLRPRREILGPDPAYETPAEETVMKTTEQRGATQHAEIRVVVTLPLLSDQEQEEGRPARRTSGVGSGSPTHTY